MRKKITLLVAVLVGLLAFGVAVVVPWRGRRALDVVASLDMAVVTWP